MKKISLSQLQLLPDTPPIFSEMPSGPNITSPKRCGICAEYLSPDQFFTDRRYKDNLSWCCKECLSDYKSQRDRQRFFSDARFFWEYYSKHSILQDLGVYFSGLSEFGHVQPTIFTYNFLAQIPKSRIIFYILSYNLMYLTSADLDADKIRSSFSSSSSLNSLKNRTTRTQALSNYEAPNTFGLSGKLFLELELQLSKVSQHLTLFKQCHHCLKFKQTYSKVTFLNNLHKRKTTYTLKENPAILTEMWGIVAQRTTQKALSNFKLYPYHFLPSRSTLDGWKKLCRECDQDS